MRDCATPLGTGVTSPWAAYRYRGKTLTDFPSEVRILEGCEPVYRRMEGWKTSLADVHAVSDFPEPARAYLALLADLLKVETVIVSTGPERRRSIVNEASDFWAKIRR